MGKELLLVALYAFIIGIFIGGLIVARCGATLAAMGF